MAAPAPKSEASLEQWAAGPVSLLLTKAERESFRQLTSDVEREKFITRFWEIRNPKPGTGTNEFQEEFYSRVAFANAFYGRDAGSEGWRTDRGRTYILFGKPQTSLSFVAHQELYPTEMWFYSNPGLSELPPFFYVLFFERDGVSGYRLYNPITDGPDKIMRAGPTKAQAYHYLRGINAELAQATLTLIPGDMVDTESYTGSMASNVVLNAVRGFNSMPSYERSIIEKTRRFEQVSSKLVYDIAETTLLAFVAVENGESWAHWRLEIQDPMRAKVKDGRVGYEIRARLFSRGRLVYERTDAPSFGVSPADQEGVNKRPLVYEERFPLAPGEYRLEVAATSRASGRTYTAEKLLSAAALDKPGFAGEVLLAGRYEADNRDRPFQFGGTHFTPLLGGRTVASQPLVVVYQLAGDGAAAADWTAEYVVGSVAGKFRKTFEDRVDMGRPGTNGVALVAKTLAIDDLSPGPYRLALRLRNKRTGEVIGRSAAFLVVPQMDERPIQITRTRPPGPQGAAEVHYERALCWLAQERAQEAYREAEASLRLVRTPVAQQLLQQLSARAGKVSQE